MYQSKTTAWPHQVQCREWMSERHAAGENGLLLALPMGVGKSKLAVDFIGEYIAEMYDKPKRVKILILCPLSVVGVWPREFQKHMGSGYYLTAPHGTISGRQISFEFAFQQNVNAVICVCHYEAAWRDPLAFWLLAQKWDIVVADESHKFKAHPKYKRDWGPRDSSTWIASAGKLADFMARLGRRAAYRLALTGTPLAHSPADIFSQARFLDGGKRFGDSPALFMSRYHPIGQPGAPWVNQHEFSTKLDEIMWKCPEDVVQLPEAVHEVREFDLSKGAMTAYREMWRDLCAQVEDGEITAQNGAVRFLRLQQITSGIGKLDDGSQVVIDAGKQLLLEDFLDDIDPSEKVVVFCQFRHDLASVEASAQAKGREYGEISGESKTGLSPDALFAEGKSILGVQLQSGGVGIDLTAARYCVYFSPGMSLANYEQSLKRVWRPGQTRPVLFLHLVARGTIDAELYTRLEQRKDLVQGIMDLARAEREKAA